MGRNRLPYFPALPSLLSLMGQSNSEILKVMLTYQDGLSTKAARTIKSLVGIDKAARQAAKGVDVFNKSVARKISTRELDSYGTKLGKLRGETRTSLRDSEMLRSTFGKGFDTGGLDKARTDLKKLREEMKKPLPSDLLAPSTPTRPRRAEDELPRRRMHHGGFFENAENVMDTGRQIGSIWRERAESLERYTDAFLELAQSRERFKAINLTGDENNEAFAAVDSTVKNLQGLTRASVTDLMADAHLGLGNLHHAIDALPMISKYKFGISTLLGSKFSDEQVEQQVQQGLKMVEMIGGARAPPAR